jgi:hypothetical protein
MSSNGYWLRKKTARRLLTGLFLVSCFTNA